MQERRFKQAHTAAINKATATINQLLDDPRIGKVKLDEIVQTTMQTDEFRGLVSQPRELQDAIIHKLLIQNPEAAERLRIARDYRNALINLETAKKNLAGMGYEMDAETGKVYDVGKIPAKRGTRGKIGEGFSGKRR